jgi:hypothetical protein
MYILKYDIVRLGFELSGASCSLIHLPWCLFIQAKMPFFLDIFRGNCCAN